MYLYLNIFIAIGLTWHCKVSKVASLQARFIDNHNLGVRCPYGDENWYKKNILLFFIFLYLYINISIPVGLIWHYKLSKEAFWQARFIGTHTLRISCPYGGENYYKQIFFLFFVTFLYLDLNIFITISLIWHCKVSKEASC